MKKFVLGVILAIMLMVPAVGMQQSAEASFTGTHTFYYCSVGGGLYKYTRYGTEHANGSHTWSQFIQNYGLVGRCYP